MSKELKFLDALRDLFVGAKVEGESGYINLMRIKARYFEQGVFPRLMEDIEAALQPFPEFREELFDRLYTFFHRYFSESGSIYFRYTPLHERVYEQVYTDDRDVMLFWKTHMLYYVKTDRLFQSMVVEAPDLSPRTRGGGQRFYFDVSTLEHKRANEKRSLLYAFKERRADGALAFSVAYSEKGHTTPMDDIRRALRQAGVQASEETLDHAFRLFERQSEVDYFINKNARAFLREQFDLWVYQYIFQGETTWTEKRIRQLQALKEIAYKIINFIAQFEDELVRIWNKPKFVLNSHYVITLDRIAAKDVDLLRRLLTHRGDAEGAERENENLRELCVSAVSTGIEAQVREWRELGMVDEAFTAEDVWQRDLLGERLHPRYQYLPLDTRYFPRLEAEILALFDHLDQELDGWLIKSENYQALNTLLPKFRERVKCIYIDPPYNTKGSEIQYVNVYKHSSWLSLVENRLSVARDLLVDEGVLCVAIDDSEYHRLYGVLVEKFGGQEAVLGTIAVRSNPSGRSTVKGVSVAHDYAVFVAKTETVSIGRLARTAKQIARYKESDEEGAFEWVNFRKHGGAAANRAARPRLFYPIFVSQEATIRVPQVEWDAEKQEWKPLEKPKQGEIVVYPIGERGEEKRWKWGHDSLLSSISDFCAKPDQTGNMGIYMKSRMKSEGMLPLTWWDKKEYSATDYGTNLLRHILGVSNAFTSPKSVYLVEDCLKVCGLGEDDFCLDFFAGSGTTAHAVINLNREDGGKRKYILVEMGDYFDTVLLPRVKKVAFSDKWKDGRAQEGQGISHLVKYCQLEQYEDALRRARYEPAEPLFIQADPYSQYVFLRDKKMLDNAQTGERVLEIDPAKEEIRVDVSKLYAGIDLAETLSCVTGKWIRRLTREEVEFEDGERVSLLNPPWELVKPLIWW